MTDSANFQTQMSEIWKARREREMYRLDLEKEVFVKMQRREKRRDELRTKVKVLHDDLVREDITSSQRVKILLSKVESLKREHQVLAAHTERLKLKKRQIELQLVTSYPIIRQTVQQEAMNSHLPAGLSQVGHNVFLQTPQASGAPQTSQYNLQLQQQQQQPYNVSQLGGVGDTVYRGIPGIISTVNSRIENMSTRGRSEFNTQANQMTNNEQFDTPTTIEDHKTKTIQKYPNTLENRLYSNPVSSNSEYLKQMTNNSAVTQVHNHPIESLPHFSTQSQVLDQQFSQTSRAVQEDINRQGIYNPAYFSSQRENSNYSSRKNSEQILYSHHENNRELQTQLRSNLEINSNETLSTARNVNTTKTPVNSEFINPSYDIENVESSSERENSNNRNFVHTNRDQEYMHDTQIEALERYPITKENESIRSESFIEKRSEDMHHVSTNQSQSQENNYHQHISEDDISDKVQQNLYQNQSELNNVSNNDKGYEHYEDSYSDGNRYDNYKNDNYNSNQDLQNYREYRTDSSFNTYNQGDYNQTEKKRDLSQESLNIRYQTEENHSNVEYQQDLQDSRENVTDSSFNTYTQGDGLQTENKKEVSQESQNIRDQTEENHPNMEYHKNSSESQNRDEYENINPDNSHSMKRESPVSEKIYEEHNYNNIKDEQVDKETLQSTSNNRTSTTKDLMMDESLTSTIKQDTFTKQYTEETKNGTSSFNKDNNISDEDSDFFERGTPVKSSAAYQNLLGVAAPSVGIESDSDDMEGQMAAMALKPKISTTGPSFKTFASTIPSLKPSATYLTDTDSLDSVEAAIQASMNKKDNQGAESREMKNSENNTKTYESPNVNPVAVSTAHQSIGATSHPITIKTKPKGPSALQLNLSDDESYNVSGGGGNESYDDDDDFFD